MKDYLFYLEFDGHRTLPIIETQPEEKITASDLKRAIDKYCKKNHYRSGDYEVLPGGEYRAYLYKKALFKKDKELIFFIKQDSGQDADL